MEVNINDVKKQIRDKISNRYGSVSKFLETPYAKKLGGAKIRAYLYDSGSLNFKVLKTLCSHLEIGNLAREIKVTRTVSYSLSSKSTTDKK